MDKTLGQRIGFVQAFLSSSTVGLFYDLLYTLFIREHLSYEIIW